MVGGDGGAAGGSGSAWASASGAAVGVGVGVGVGDGFFVGFFVGLGVGAGCGVNVGCGAWSVCFAGTLAGGGNCTTGALVERLSHDVGPGLRRVLGAEVGHEVARRAVLPFC